MNRVDPQDTGLYTAIRRHYEDALGPGFGAISDATDIQPSPDGRYIAFTGIVVDRLGTSTRTEICLADARGGPPRRLTAGHRSAYGARWAPDGTRLAFVAVDDARLGRPAVLDPHAGTAAEPLDGVDGSVEYLTWSPDGDSLLLGVAPPGAGIPGAFGSSRISDGDVPDWAPRLEAGTGDGRCRWVALVHLSDGVTRRVSPPGLNVWEATWCGSDRLAVICSDGGGENTWYDARLALVDVRSGAVRDVHDPRTSGAGSVQLGLPVGSPTGHLVAFVEGIASDRGVLAGDVRLADLRSGTLTRVETADTDISHLAWRDDRTLLTAGVRGATSVVGDIDTADLTFRRLWADEAFAGGGARWLPAAAPAPGGVTYLLRDDFHRPCELARLEHGRPVTLHSFAHPGTSAVGRRLGSIESVSYAGPDGMELQGWLALPADSRGPRPTVLWLHGGPVGVCLNQWAMRRWGLVDLLDRGYAVFSPNPRGSLGRGQKFVAPVVHDMGGLDACDVLAGLDFLVTAGITDPSAVGLTGASYGGYLTAWLLTQSRRFAAGVPVAPITDWHTFRQTSDIPRFADLFLGPDPASARAPIDHVHEVSAPVLTVVGQLDDCTPPTQGLQWHRGLLARSTATSVLATYPKTGHVPRQLPELPDFVARVVMWFAAHMPAR